MISYRRPTLLMYLRHSLKLKPCLIRGRWKWEEKKGLGFGVRQSWTWVQPPLFIRCMTRSPEPQFPLLENGIIMASTSCCCCWWWWCWLWWWWPFQFARAAMTKCPSWGFHLHVSLSHFPFFLLMFAGLGEVSRVLSLPCGLHSCSPNQGG